MTAHPTGPVPTTRLEDCGVHHAYPELHHCSECKRAYCGRASRADLERDEAAKS